MAHPLKIIINNTNMRAAHRAATVTVTTAARAAARNVHQCSRFTFATTAAKSTEAKTTHSDSCITRQSSFGTFFGMPSAFVRNSQGFRNATKCFPPTTTTTRAFFFQSQHQQQQLLQQQRRTYARIDRKYYSTTTTAAAIENVGNTTTSSGSPPSRQPKEDNNNNNNKQFIEHITTNFQFSTDDDGKPEPRIAISVIGVGGAGGNAINNMIKSGLKGVKFIACNTDAQSLSRSQADVRLQIGKNVTKGLGAGNHADIGKKAAEESIAEIEKVLENTHMVFITAGFGGGTGTGASPVIARVAKEKGILVVAVVTKPFSFEGKPRSKTAERGIEELSAYADTLLVVSNENLVSLSNETTSLINAFKQADEFLLGAIRSVTDLMVKPGLINLDFADIRSVMHNMGRAMMGSGEVEGPSSKARGTRAAELAISNKLLDADSSSLAGAKAIILNITGGPDMTLFEVDAAANRVRRELDDDANIIFGTSLDDAMTNKIRVSVMAMGIGQRRVV